MRVRLRSSVPGTVSEGWRSRVRHGVGVPGMLIWGVHDAGTPLCRRTRCGLCAQWCGYALVWAYPLYGAGTPALWRPREIIL